MTLPRVLLLSAMVVAGCSLSVDEFAPAPSDARVDTASSSDGGTCGGHTCDTDQRCVQGECRKKN